MSDNSLGLDYINYERKLTNILCLSIISREMSELIQLPCVGRLHTYWWTIQVSLCRTFTKISKVFDFYYYLYVLRLITENGNFCSCMVIQTSWAIWLNPSFCPYNKNREELFAHKRKFCSLIYTITFLTLFIVEQKVL